MANVRFVKNAAGYVSLMNGAKIQAVCGSAARAVASAAGPGHSSDTRSGKSRAHARAFTTTTEARVKEFGGSGPLKRALSAGRV